MDVFILMDRDNDNIIAVLDNDVVANAIASTDESYVVIKRRVLVCYNLTVFPANTK